MQNRIYLPCLNVWATAIRKSATYEFLMADFIIRNLLLAIIIWMLRNHFSDL